MIKSDILAFKQEEAINIMEESSKYLFFLSDFYQSSFLHLRSNDLIRFRFRSKTFLYFKSMQNENWYQLVHKSYKIK